MRDWLKEKVKPQVFLAILGLAIVGTISAIAGITTDNAAAWVAVGAAATKMGDIAMSLIEREK